MDGHDHDNDVLIIGGGPAGISAAIWCADLGLAASIFEEKEEFGGQLLNTFNPVTNYPGIEAANGTELRDKFLKSLDKRSVRRFLGAKITSADLARKTVTLADGKVCTGRAIIIATGVRRRRLGIPGEAEFEGRGILESGTASKDEVMGKTVVIVGGGDAALENALVLGESAARVIVVHRGTQFSSARGEFTRRVSSRPNVEALLGFTPAAITGSTRLDAVELLSAGSGKAVRLEADHLLIRIGSLPNTELFRGQIELDDKGDIRINSHCETDIQGVFAAGDVASPEAPTISNAVGQGATAVKMIEKMLTTRK